MSRSFRIRKEKKPLSFNYKGTINSGNKEMESILDSQDSISDSQDNMRNK